MKQSVFEIVRNERLADGIYRLHMEGDTSAITAPGQFVDLKLNGHFLRRPISVCDWSDGRLTLIYKVLGRGTQELTEYPVGAGLDLLTGLGNGFDLSKSGGRPLLVGGGVGIPPLYGLAKRLAEERKAVSAVIGFNSADDRFYENEFRTVCRSVTVTTMDGSCGLAGTVTDGMAQVQDYSYVYTCGPERMLKAVYIASETSGQFSFEERMGCGFGACMGCSCETKYGAKRICRDGPVLEKEEIIWDD